MTAATEERAGRARGWPARMAPGKVHQLRPTYPYYLANKPYTPNTDLEVTNKFTGEVRRRRQVLSWLYSG